MKVPKSKVFWLLAWAVVGVFSYDLYGGYERIIVCLDLPAIHGMSID